MRSRPVDAFAAGALGKPVYRIKNIVRHLPLKIRLRQVMQHEVTHKASRKGVQHAAADMKMPDHFLQLLPGIIMFYKIKGTIPAWLQKHRPPGQQSPALFPGRGNEPLLWRGAAVGGIKADYSQLLCKTAEHAVTEKAHSRTFKNNDLTKKLAAMESV